MPSMVPTALRTELSEYAHLLRTIRVQSTQDLVPQLIPSSSSRTLRSKGATTGPGLEEQEVSELSEGDEEEHETQHDWKAREASDKWTRWPLLEEDVYVPEWTLEDEVALIAKEILGTLGADDEGSDSHMASSPSTSHMVTKEDTLPASYTKSLATSSSAFLSQLFAAIAAHWPLAEKIMQNRIRPISGEAIIDIVSATGMVDSTVLEKVRLRMDAIYGISDAVAVERLKVLERSKNNLDSAEEQYGEDLFGLP